MEVITPICMPEQDKQLIVTQSIQNRPERGANYVRQARKSSQQEGVRPVLPTSGEGLGGVCAHDRHCCAGTNQSQDMHVCLKYRYS